MTPTDHGPGVTWLAERAGVAPDELLHDGNALMAALESAAKDGLDLAKRLMSEDPTIRTRAEAEARAVRQRFAASGAPTPEERFRARVAEALAKNRQP
jgi:hypothetical protein